MCVYVSALVFYAQGEYWKLELKNVSKWVIDNLFINDKEKYNNDHKKCRDSQFKSLQNFNNNSLQNIAFQWKKI